MQIIMKAEILGIKTQVCGGGGGGGYSVAPFLCVYPCYPNVPPFPWSLYEEK